MIGTKKGKYETATKAQQLESFYKQVCDKMPRIEFGTWEEIESIKIFYNTFISNKISLVNMIQDVAVKLGHMDVDKVTGALSRSTKRIVSSATASFNTLGVLVTFIFFSKAELTEILSYPTPT